MGSYRARDLLLPPSLLSFARMPLAVAFLMVVAQPPWALGVLLVAGVTDVLDGYLARRLQQATPTGAVVDAVFDKLFVTVVLGGLVVQGSLTWLEAASLATREIGELPLVIWWVAHDDGRHMRRREPRANRLGKAVTVCQFVAIATVLIHGEPWYAGLALAALVGVASAVGYWRRELLRRRG